MFAGRFLLRMIMQRLLRLSLLGSDTETSTELSQINRQFDFGGARLKTRFGQAVWRAIRKYGGYSLGRHGRPKFLEAETLRVLLVILPLPLPTALWPPPTQPSLSRFSVLLQAFGVLLTTSLCPPLPYCPLPPGRG